MTIIGNEDIKEEEVSEETEEIKYPWAVAVRFRGSGKPYSFGAWDDNYEKGDWVVVETAQGIEMGQADADALNIEKYGLHMPSKPVIRKATELDHRNYEINLEEEKKAFKICNDEIADLALDMNLLSAQYTLDRSKVLFVYLADQRVDFRELLKRLGSRLHCRIELRQIGERDKAKMVGGIGMCGMECCCRRFKNHFDVISINMAKNQLLALNIDKLSGMCGKLKCCLKYEDEDYKKLTEGLPKMGSQVEYEGVVYRITNMNVMNEEAKLENHEAAIFITLQELREKAIPRKGVVMQKKAVDENGQPIRKKMVHNTGHAERPDRPVHVNMELSSEERMDKKENRQEKQHKSETRTFGHKKNNEGKNAETGNNAPAKNVEKRTFGSKNKNHSNMHGENDQTKKPEVKNVTVRTFGRKKKEETEQ